ncbi:hypothetical protein NMK71_05015 [Weeksellaceae bacterium KMM 9713]|uniref:Uncharacterized protein n=1 Tax=Profundicola chukchiensis TaxID=2961959 RepID=A0A9X4MZE7_9FLAO|nr:hypothetical protein [Profundicola chukchiensis]MDG4945767.1 hypothetical protein [Profundicola chukchiensis]
MENYSLINPKTKIKSATFTKIIDSINAYLKKNKGTVADYELLKDIVDRNLDKEDDKISGNLALPLYLGLMGTMLGVVIGLMFMPELQEMDTNAQVSGSNNNILSGVNELLNGVKIAMIASALGLLLTIINTVYYFNVRKAVEENKNNFLNFIQVNLLPVLNQSTANSLTLLQNNLVTFNKDFSENSQKFSKVLTHINSSSENNLKIIKTIEQLDLSNLVKYNKETMDHFNKAFKKLEKFGDYLSQSTSFLEEARKLNNSLRENLINLESYHNLIDNLDKSTSVLNEAGQVITIQYKEVDQRKNQINAVIADYTADTENQIQKLKAENEEKLNLFKQEHAEIHDSLESFYDKLTNYTHSIFEEEGNTFKNLNGTLTTLNSNISNLKTIEKGLSDLKEEIRNIKPSAEVEVKFPKKTKLEKLMPYFILGFIVLFLILSTLMLLRVYNII